MPDRVDDHSRLPATIAQENGEARRKRPYVRPELVSESPVSRVTGAGVSFELESGLGGLVS